ncbi:MAG: rhodanese-like domain-containing protein [Ectothiorhodospiraceae bacterium]|nr:rhodanese-like domain-containing protein [Ectothiorhodospiraceae bacterium]
MRKSFKDYLAEANASIRTCSVQDALVLVGQASTVFVDVRDGTEIASEGAIPGAVHASRGLLEFKIDPESPMHDPVFAAKKRFIFYCGTGGRSALAAHRAQEMGISQVSSMAGGFRAWVAAGGPVSKA